MQDEVEKLFEEGVSNYEQEKFDAAESKFLEALQIDSTSDEIKYNLALVYFEKKEYAKTNFLISQIKEIDCDEIIDELEKVEFEFTEENPFQKNKTTENEFFNQQIKNYIELLNDEYLPKNIQCEFCDKQIELSELERQNKYYNCPHCKNRSDIRLKQRELEREFDNKPDSELFEILINAQNFKLEFLLAAKKEINTRNLQLFDNEEFKLILKNSILNQNRL